MYTQEVTVRRERLGGGAAILVGKHGPGSGVKKNSPKAGERDWL